MKLSLLTSLLLFVSFFWSQIPDYAKDWNHATPDTSIHYSGPDTAYTITEYWLKKGTEITALNQRNSICKVSYFVNSSKDHAWERYSEFSEGKLVAMTSIKDTRYSKDIYNKDGEVIATYYSPDNGKTLIKQSDVTYHSKKKKTVTYYHPNGQIKLTGKMRLCRITAGCDSGMHVFQRYGTWKTYNEDGSLESSKEYKIKEHVFEPL